MLLMPLDRSLVVVVPLVFHKVMVDIIILLLLHSIDIYFA